MARLKRVVGIGLAIVTIASCSSSESGSDSTGPERTRSGVLAPTVVESVTPLGPKVSFGNSVRGQRFDRLLSCPTADFCATAASGVNAKGKARPYWVTMGASGNPTAVTPPTMFDGPPNFLTDDTPTNPRPPAFDNSVDDPNRSADVSAIGCTTQKRCIAMGSTSVYPPSGAPQSYVAAFDGSTWGKPEILSGHYGQCLLSDGSVCYASAANQSSGLTEKCSSAQLFGLYCWANRETDAPEANNETYHAVRCPSDDSCLALGSFVTRTGAVQLFVARIPLTEPNQTSITFTRLGDPISGVNLFVNPPVLDCASASRCVVASVSADRTLFSLIQMSGGTWGAPTSVPVPAGSYTATSPTPQGVDCAPSGSCTVVGTLTTGSNAMGPGLFTLDVTAQGSVAPPAIPSLPNPSSYVDNVSSISCPADGSCVVSGTYYFMRRSGNATRAFALAQQSGVWASSVSTLIVSAEPAANGSATDTSLTNVRVDKMDCPAAGQCVIVGSYEPYRSYTLTSYVGVMTGGVWSGTTSLSKLFTYSAMRCTTALSCTAVYNEGMMPGQAYVDRFSVAMTESSVTTPPSATTSTTKAPAVTTTSTTAAPSTTAPTTVATTVATTVVSPPSTPAPPVTAAPTVAPEETQPPETTPETTTTTLPEVRVRGSISFTQIAALVGIVPVRRSSSGVVVSSASRRFCKVSGSKVVGVKAGPCTFTYSYRVNSRARKQTFTLTLTVV